MVLIIKKERCFTFKSNLNLKNLGQNLNVYFNKKYLFQTEQYLKQINLFIEMVISVAVDCKSMEMYDKSDSRQGKA